MPKRRSCVPTEQASRRRPAHNVDTWRFYLRFQPAVYDFNSRRAFWSISEIMQADRMPTGDAKKVLAMSDKVTVGA